MPFLQSLSVYIALLITTNNLFSPEKLETKQGMVTSPFPTKEPSGYITSPNFPHGYALNGETFTYTLQNLDPYGHIRLVFDDWEIAKDSEIQVNEPVQSITRPFILLHYLHLRQFIYE